MTTLTVRLPDEKHRRLKALAKSRGTPLNRLTDEMTTQLLAKFDAEIRFKLRVERSMGQEARRLKLLIKLCEFDSTLNSSTKNLIAVQALNA